MQGHGQAWGGGGRLASCGLDSALEQVEIFVKPCREGGTT